MAGDWIKMRHDLPDDPAVIKLAEETACVDESHVVGVLHKLWSWADRQSRSGHAPGVTVSWLSRYLVVPGFTDCLQEVGWLRVTKSGIQLPRFGRHNSESAKKRALAARRQVTHRSHKRNAGCVTREEKRREETSLDRSIDRFDRVDEAIWKEAMATARAIDKQIREAWPDWRMFAAFAEKIEKAALCVVVGALPLSWLDEAIAKMLQGKRKARPAAWLGKVLAADAAELGCDFDAYQRAIQLPKKGGE